MVGQGSISQGISHAGTSCFSPLPPTTSSRSLPCPPACREPLLPVPHSRHRSVLQLCHHSAVTHPVLHGHGPVQECWFTGDTEKELLHPGWFLSLETTSRGKGKGRAAHQGTGYPGSSTQAVKQGRTAAGSGAVPVHVQHHLGLGQALSGRRQPSFLQMVLPPAHPWGAVPDTSRLQLFSGSQPHHRGDC